MEDHKLMTLMRLSTVELTGLGTVELIELMRTLNNDELKKYARMIHLKVSCSDSTMAIRRNICLHLNHKIPHGTSFHEHAGKSEDHINPKHYKEHPSGVECITVTRHFNFNIGNAIKYLWRQGLKDSNPSIQDLKKAEWYIKDEIKKLEVLKR